MPICNFSSRLRCGLSALGLAAGLCLGATHASATLVGDEVGGCLGIIFPPCPDFNLFERVEGSGSTATVGGGVEFLYENELFASTTQSSADFTAASLTLTHRVVRIGSGIGSVGFGTKEWVFTDLDWVDTPAGGIVDVAVSGGDLVVDSLSFTPHGIRVLTGPTDFLMEGDSRSVTLDIIAHAAPEPASLTLLAFALMGIGGAYRRSQTGRSPGLLRGGVR